MRPFVLLIFVVFILTGCSNNSSDGINHKINIQPEINQVEDKPDGNQSITSEISKDVSRKSETLEVTDESKSTKGDILPDSKPSENVSPEIVAIDEVTPEANTYEDVSPESDTEILIINEQINVNEEQALKKINNLIGEGLISLIDINCQVQYFYKNEEGFHVIRIAFIDPNDPEFTVTTARYLVSQYSGEVFEEELFSGDLTKIAD